MKKYLTIIFPIVLLASCAGNTSVEKVQENPQTTTQSQEYAPDMEIAVVEDDSVSETAEEAESNVIISDEIEITEIDSNF